MFALAYLKLEIFTFKYIDIDLSDHIHKFIHVFKAVDTVQVIVPARFYVQFSRCDKHSGSVHIKARPQIGYEVAATEIAVKSRLFKAVEIPADIGGLYSLVECGKPERI